MTPLRTLKAIGKGLIFSTPSILAALFIYATLSIIQNPVVLVDPSRVQRVELEVAVQRSNGQPALGADVEVLLLCEEPVVVAKGRASLPGGIFRAPVVVPRVLKRTKPDVYAAVNLLVAATWRGESGLEVGVAAFSLDPTNMVHPSDKRSAELKLTKVPEIVKSAVVGGFSDPYYQGPCWLPTGVVN